MPQLISMVDLAALSEKMRNRRWVFFTPHFRIYERVYPSYVKYEVIPEDWEDDRRPTLFTLEEAANWILSNRKQEEVR